MDIEIEDIAHGLARVARWNGQTTGQHAFSVAQHSVVVEEISAHLSPGLAPNWRLAALLHDAPEYVIGDMISPFKSALGLDYRTFETRLEQAIHIRFGLPADVPEKVRVLIKSADRASAFFEATQLAGFEHAEGPVHLRRPARGLQAGDRASGAARSPRPGISRGFTSFGSRRLRGRYVRLRHGMTTPVVIGLSAVIIALRDGEGCVLTVRPKDSLTERASTLEGLPFGPFDPIDHRTFELALREFVTRQTRFELGYVEQLYTFGDKGRDAPRADVGAGAARVISVGYLALAPTAEEIRTPDTAWSPWSRFFPWEDWRGGRPELIDLVIAPALERWAGRSETWRSRARHLFAFGDSPWNEERVLERYELLYEAGLAPEAARDRARASGGAPAEPGALTPALGEPMISDHRRILATGLGRLRGKMKYRPVVFELMGEAFTLSALQRAVEEIAGVALHKQNFRRVVERTGLVEGLGHMDSDTGGRPAELFRFRRELLADRPASGLSLPAATGVIWTEVQAVRVGVRRERGIEKGRSSRFL